MISFRKTTLYFKLKIYLQLLRIHYPKYYFFFNADLYYFIVLHHNCITTVYVGQHYSVKYFGIQWVFILIFF